LYILSAQVNLRLLVVDPLLGHHDQDAALHKRAMQ
jgi:hypothetical protein